MQREDCHATCQPCKGNPFRYIDWAQNPTPFDKISPCPSKLGNEDLLKSKLTDKNEKKTTKEYKSAEDDDRLVDENVTLGFEDLGLEDDNSIENQDDERAEFENTHVWGPEMDSELAGQGIQDEPDAKSGKWWEPFLGSARKDSRQKGSMWTDDYDTKPDIEKSLQKPKDMRLVEEADSSNTPRKSLGGASKMWTEDQKAEPDTEKGPKTLPAGDKKFVTDETYKYDQGIPESIQGETQALPSGIDTNKLQDDTQGKDKHEVPGRIEQYEQRYPQGAQGDTLVQPEEIQRALAESEQKDTQALKEGAQKDVQSFSKIAQKKEADRNAERKRKRLAKRKKLRRSYKQRDKKNVARTILAGHDVVPGQEVTETKTPKELTLLDEEPMSLGDLDAVTKRQYEIDEMWYRVQTGRFMPQTIRPLAPHWRWNTALKIKHFIQKVLNPLDTLRARIYSKDMHGPLRGNVAWQKDAGQGWGCGCPALPCICHLHTTKPPKKIPKGISAKKRGAVRSRLMERVDMRVRIEERLHEKLADLPPPHEHSMEPLFCLGVDKCVARQAMTRPLLAAAERTRRDAVQRFPCDPGCQAKCIIAYADTVQMLRLQAAAEIFGSNDIQVATTRGKSINNMKFTSKKKDMKFIREKCAEIKVEAPFPTKAICYRVKEVRRATNRMPNREARDNEVSATVRGARRAGQEARQPAPGAALDPTALTLTEDAAAVDATTLTLAEDAAQSTTEISSSRVQRNRQMSRRKTRWEHYRDHFRDFRVALRDAKRTLAPSSNIWKLNNLKYWFACCWLSPKGNGMVCSDIQEEDTYPHLAKLIQEEERYRNVINLKNYLISHDFNL